MKFAFFPGCMIQVRYPQMEAAVRKTVDKLGVELVDLPGLAVHGAGIQPGRAQVDRASQRQGHGGAFPLVGLAVLVEFPQPVVQAKTDGMRPFEFGGRL